MFFAQPVTSNFMPLEYPQAADAHSEAHDHILCQLRGNLQVIGCAAGNVVAEDFLCHTSAH